jgi:ATP-binding cassette subfamily B protein
MRRFVIIYQPDAMDCGPACVCMIAEHYGKQYALEHLRDNCFIGREGVSMLGISKAAEKIGFHTVGGRLPCKEQAHPSELKLFFRLLAEKSGRN